ncbi:hypothetical protein B841_02750 [Corynebacterium maris DSM 45190]|uniref:PhiRv1 phage protein n=1 Tax=Corynebacterium maris DSM 45190 TaxID=1224163 RepID=S5TH79_9CORY|nr:hypothetical protein [Corynebacterium maris]AGS34033.1 hypothetical protein B841_02750 [Corynebacterium maris DSM 45190]
MTTPVDHTLDISLASGQLAAARRWHPDTDTSALERNLAVARIANYARKVLADTPPLEPEDLDRLQDILQAGGAR